MIRHFLSQLLDVLQVLRKSDVIHCDIKPENILLCAPDSVDVKMIDFGSACQESNIVYSYVQSRFYRSPEVILGAHYTSKIDIWSLGCVAGELFLGLPLFPGTCEHNMLVRIEEMLGHPPDRMLDGCRNAGKYYWIDETRSSGSKYHLKTDQEHSAPSGVSVQSWKRYFGKQSLRELILSEDASSDSSHGSDFRHRDCFADFLSGLLQVRAITRLECAGVSSLLTCT